MAKDRKYGWLFDVEDDSPENTDWAAWYTKQKNRICFVDSTGFW